MREKLDGLEAQLRGEVCALLPAIRELRGEDGVLGVVLSGAGPSVMVLCRSESAAPVSEKVRALARGAEPGSETQVAVCALDSKGLQATGDGMPLW